MADSLDNPLPRHARFNRTVGSISLSGNARAVLGDIYGNPALQINHASFYFVLPNGDLADAISAIDALGGRRSSLRIRGEEDEISSLSSAFSKLNLHDDDCLGCGRCISAARRQRLSRRWSQYNRSSANRLALELRTRGQAPNSPSIRIVQAAGSVQFSERLLRLVQEWMSTYATQKEVGMRNGFMFNTERLGIIDDRVTHWSDSDPEALESKIVNATTKYMQPAEKEPAPSILLQALSILTPQPRLYIPETTNLIQRIFLKTITPVHTLDHILYRIVALISTSHDEQHSLHVPWTAILEIFAQCVRQCISSPSDVSDELAFASSCVLANLLQQFDHTPAAEFKARCQSTIQSSSSGATYAIQSLKYRLARCHDRLGELESAASIFEEIRLTYAADLPLDNEFLRGVATCELGIMHEEMGESTGNYFIIDGLRWMLRAVDFFDDHDMIYLASSLRKTNQYFPDEITKLRTSFPDVFAVLDEEFSEFL